MSLRRSWILLLAVLSVAVLTAISAFAGTSEKLFIITRSKNADQVHYDARLNSDGSIDGKNPVDGYWMNKNADGTFTRAEITTFQKIAYGWDTEATGNGTYALKLRAFNDRKMSIVRVNGRARVETTIAGKPAYLTRLYVATDESGLMPKVLYVDVFGADAASGAAVTEHITK